MTAATLAATVASCSRRRCPSCCTGSIPGTSRFKSTHRTATAVFQDGRNHIGFRAATKHEELQTRPHRHLPARVASRTVQLRATDNAQSNGGSTAKTRVPRTRPGRGQDGSLTPVNTTAAYWLRIQTAAKGIKRARGRRGLKPRSKRDLDAAAHEQTTFWPRRFAHGTAETPPAAANHANGDAKPTASRTTNRARKPHLEDAGDGLERVLESNGKQTPATRKQGPRRGSTSLARFEASRPKLQEGKD